MSDDDLVARLKDALNKDEGRARLRLAAEADRMSIAPVFALRVVAAHREILALHQPEWTDYKDADGDDRTSLDCKECESSGTPDNWPCPTVKALAAVYGDDAS